MVNFDTLPGPREGCQPAPAALQHFPGSGKVVPFHVVAGYCHLQDTPVQFPHRAGFSPPGSLQFFVGGEKLTPVEKLDTLRCSRRERPVLRTIRVRYVL